MDSLSMVSSKTMDKTKELLLLRLKLLAGEAEVEVRGDDVAPRGSGTRGLVFFFDLLQSILAVVTTTRVSQRRHLWLSWSMRSRARRGREGNLAFFRPPSRGPIGGVGHGGPRWSLSRLAGPP